jgi:DNA polymerase
MKYWGTNMSRITVIDIETYFDQEYSLKRLTTEEYVRDARFSIHCVAIACDDGTREIFTEDFANALRPYMDDFVIAQHAQFDGLILSHQLGLYPKYWGCTLSMARAQLQFLKSHSLSSLCTHFGLAEKTIDYNAFRGKRVLDLETLEMLTEGCLHDAELTLAIATQLLASFPAHELQVVDKTIRMFTEPCLSLDAPRLSTELDRVIKAKEDALIALGITKEQLQSSKKFGLLLEAQGIEVPMKISPTTGKGIPALSKTDEGMKGLLEHENETVAALATARLGQKSTLLETRCRRLLGMYSRGYLPVYLKYHGAHTGRWSGGDKVNFQNFPRGSEIRKSIMAPTGYKLVGVDSAQIECRLLNWFCGQQDIIEAFRVGRDIYCENATEFFAREITKANQDERQFGKVMELSSGYGCGALKFKTISLQQAKRRLTDEEAQRAIGIYRNKHDKVTRMWRIMGDVIKDMHKGMAPYKVHCITVDGYRIYMPDGTFLDYTGLRWDGDNYVLGDSKVYGGLVVENIIQKLGLLVVANAIVYIDDMWGYKLATTTHDDIVYLIPEEDTEALGNVLMAMKTPPNWCPDIPLGAEGFESQKYDK